ncbi:MAG: ATP synthase F1 subunit epsilon [bacterium]|nr:ATP synthase F1 subunit epsilon [bacterium]
MIEFEIVTPQRKLFRIHCSSVTLPGLDGEFEILAGHAALLTALKTGIASVKEPKSIDEDELLFSTSPKNFRFMIAEGFAEVSHKKVSVLCEAAALPSEVNVDSEKALIQKLHEQMNQLSHENDKELKLAAAEIERATARIQIS